MSAAVLERIQSIVQQDVNNRGLAADPQTNLINYCHDDFALACQSLAATPRPVVGIITGFYVPRANLAETDGPLGSVFLTKILVALGAKVFLGTESYSHDALAIALGHLGLEEHVTLVRLPTPLELVCNEKDTGQTFLENHGHRLTHLVAIERVGPSHTPETVEKQPHSGSSAEVVERFRKTVSPEHWDQCHTMRGTIFTERVYPSHQLFEQCQGRVTTIGIGDGGNEIGMGKIPWEVIDRNVPKGGIVACRVPTDHLIVSGISNWGAYGLAAGVWHLRGKESQPALFDDKAEHELWLRVLEQAQLVDGITLERKLTVDGLDWERYAQPLREIAMLLA